MPTSNSLQPTYTEQFARFIKAVRFESLSAEDLNKTKECILDSLGSQLVGSTLPWTRTVYDYACEIAATGPCTVVGTHSRFSALEASFVNATFGHACEYDDVGHAGVGVIPAALAIAEQLNTTGREFVTTVALGYEMFFRLFNAIVPRIFERGFHHQVVLGVFSSAAVAGRLLDLDERQLVHAFGIAGSHASGTAEYDQSGGEVKRMHAGLGARGGIQSAMLARRGYTGPLAILEGRRGIFRTFVDVAHEERVVAGLGEEFTFVPEVNFKLCPAVGCNLAAIQAFGRLVDEHQFSTGDVCEINVAVREYAVLHGAAIVVPTDVLSAQFSLAYSLAVRLVAGRNDLDVYMNQALWSDRQIIEVAGKVHAYADASAVGDRAAGSLVSVKLRDGRTLEHYEQYRRGTLKNPATKEELVRKFKLLAGRVLDEQAMDAVCRVVDDLENAESVRPLAALLTPRK